MSSFDWRKNIEDSIKDGLIHGTIIQTGITYNKILCHRRNLAAGGVLSKKAKIF